MTKHFHSTTLCHLVLAAWVCLSAQPQVSQAAECSNAYGDSEVAMTLAGSVATEFQIYFAESYSIHSEDFETSSTGQLLNDVEYRKLMYSYWLIWYGIDWEGSLDESEPFVDPNDGQVKTIVYNRAWHSPALDYGALTMTAGKLTGGHRFHDGYRIHQHLGDGQAYATTSSQVEWGLFGNEVTHRRVTLWCAVFDPLNGYHGDASGRASTLVHEFWHAHNDYELDYWHHQRCFQKTRPPSPDQQSESCDRYNPIQKGAFAPGNWYKSHPVRIFFTPEYLPMGSFQAQLEFACDLADFPMPYIPQVVVEDADWKAYQVMTERFVDSTLPENTIPYSCGPATPYDGQPEPTRWEGSQDACAGGAASCKTSDQCPNARSVCVEKCCFQIPT